MAVILLKKTVTGERQPLLAMIEKQTGLISFGRLRAPYTPTH
jgi:hypothetical protein